MKFSLELHVCILKKRKKNNIKIQIETVYLRLIHNLLLIHTIVDSEDYFQFTGVKFQVKCSITQKSGVFARDSRT